MSTIGPVNQLVAVITSQLAHSGAPQPANATRKTGKSTSSHKANRDLQSLIATRVKSIESDDAQRGRKAFRVFLEALLLSHFGEQLINDVKFYQLVDDIHHALEADPGTRVMVDQAIDQLLNQTT